MENQPTPLTAMSAVQENELIIAKYDELKPLMDRLKEQSEFLKDLENTNGNINIKLFGQIKSQSINSDSKEFLIPIMKSKIKATKASIKIIKKQLKELL